MNKNIIYAAVLAVLCAVAYFVVKNENKSTINAEDNNFSVADTAGIDKIFLADKGGNQILLQRTDNKNWTVNEKHIAARTRINGLLKAIKRMTVRNPVAKSGIENAKRSLAAQGSKVEIYSKDKLLRTYYVGGSTPDSKGTYMIMQGSEVPFVMHILGWEGYLSTRFDPSSLGAWRDVGIFRAKNPEKIIQNITLQSLKPNQKTIEIQRTTDTTFALTTSGKPTNTPNAQILKYLENYKYLNIETYGETDAQTDSITKTQPIYILSIETTNKEKLLINFFDKIKPGYTDNKNVMPMPDPDRYYYYIPAKNEFGVAQIPNYEKIFELLKVVK